MQHLKQPHTTDHNSAAKFKAFHRKLRVYSLNGCYAQTLTSRFSKICELTHDWRITVPVLMSNAYQGRNIYEASNAASSERLNYELSKVSLKSILRKQADVVIFDPTGDFITAFYEKDSCIINDIGCGLFGKEITWPSSFSLSQWEKINPRSAIYVQKYVHYLSEFCSWAQNHNIRVIGLKHHVCTRSIAEDGLHAIDDATISDTNWWIDALWAEIENAQLDLGIVSMSRRLDFTSADAPYGQSAYHPVDEYFDVATDKLCDYMMIGEKIRDEIFHDVVVNRVKMRASLNNRLATAMDERDAALGESRGLIIEIERLRKKVTQQECDLDRLTAELSVARTEPTSSAVAHKSTASEKSTQPNALSAPFLSNMHDDDSSVHCSKDDVDRFMERVSLLKNQTLAVRSWSRAVRRRHAVSFMRAARIVDETWYIDTNPDVREAGTDPVEHFLLYGIREGRHPAPRMNPSLFEMLRSSLIDLSEMRGVRRSL